MTVPLGDRSGRERLPARVLLTLALLVGSSFVMVLNETTMTTALPVVVDDLGVAVTTAQWLSSGFLLTMAVVVPTTGYLLSRFPPRRIYLSAVGLFCVGTVLCALAPGFGLLLAGRVVQASGSAIMVPLLMTSIMTLVPDGRRGRVMGTMAVVQAVAPATGPTIAGAVLAVLGWRWIFWIVLACAGLMLLAGVRWMHVEATTSRARLDLLSVLLAAGAFSLLVYGLARFGEASGEPGSGGVPAWVWIAAGAVLLAVFVRRQLRLGRDDAALLDLRPLAIRAYTLPLVLADAGYLALFSSVILLPFYIQHVLGLSPLVAGLAVLPGGTVMGVLGPVVGQAYDRFGVRAMAVPASVVVSASLWSFTALGATSPIWLVVTLHVLMSVGVAMSFTPLVTEALGVLPASLHAHGSAILTSTQQVAGAAGAALFVTVMTLASGATGGVDATGVRSAFVVAAVIATGTVLGSLLLQRRSSR
ncbi:DHA2 family efflux MFS transporter permease subunit [Pseudonocardia phyllosphaerae]|uniref:DHA2 family efflux MFS transporter permease subunit n=1 Tax=Pseudonocardia phyllosphaerae TaxID=3390502 RepID=UPI0039784917